MSLLSLLFSSLQIIFVVLLCVYAMKKEDNKVFSCLIALHVLLIVSWICV